jgi:hypothetical protein
MTTTLALNYAAAIPVGHTIEVTEFEDERPEKKRKGFDMAEAFRHPVVQDLDTGIRYMNHVHASRGGNGGNEFTPNRYPLTPRAALTVARVWKGRVVGCALVFVEGIGTQHTALEVEEL